MSSSTGCRESLHDFRKACVEQRGHRLAVRAEMSDERLRGHGILRPNRRPVALHARRDAARNRQPRHWHIATKGIRPQATLPRRNRDPGAAHRSQQQHRHQSVHAGHQGMPRLPRKMAVRLMHHQFDEIPHSCPPCEPQAEREIHRSIAEAMRYPLHEQPTGSRTGIELCADAPEVARRTRAERRVDGHPDFASRGSPEHHTCTSSPAAASAGRVDWCKR